MSEQAAKEKTFATADGLSGSLTEGENGDMEIRIQWEEGSRWEALEEVEDGEKILEMIITGLVEDTVMGALIMEEEGLTEEASQVRTELDEILTSMTLASSPKVELRGVLPEDPDQES